MTLIEFYDKDIIKNILGTLTLKPNKVIFLYDEAISDMNYFYSLIKCFKKHIPNIIFEKFPVNIMSIDDIYDKTICVINENERCILELTGGSELMIIAGYKAGSEKGIEMIYTDITKGEMIDLNKINNIRKTAKLELSDFVDAKGACFIGNSHNEPEPSRYKDILKMSHILFTNLSSWRSTCIYLQTILAENNADVLEVKSRSVITLKNGQKVSADKELMHAFVKTKFIKDLNYTNENVRFKFTSKEAKGYMINYGIWLEMFVFISAKEAGVFDDIKLGTMIDWNAYDGVSVTGNEIDIILTDNSMPVFISCKLREADTAALNELVMAKRRLGGWFSKCIIVTFGNDKVHRTGTYKRALELGVEMLDKNDILSSNFGERLTKSIRDHDLVGLKWKKI